MKLPNRENGYYWCRTMETGTWIVAAWDNVVKRWAFGGMESPQGDGWFWEVDERRIVKDETAKPDTGAADGLREALQFYANPANWTAGRWTRGDIEDDDADEPVQKLICIDHQNEDGIAVPFADCGDRARKALAALYPAPATASSDENKDQTK